MTDDLEEQLNGLVETVGGMVNFTVEEQQKITRSGSKAMQKVVAEETKKRHYNAKRDTSKLAHLADSVTSGRLERERIDGSSAVGFSIHDVNHARIARFLNDGTIKRPGDSFFDQAIEHSKGAAFGAQASAISKIQERKSQ